MLLVMLFCGSRWAAVGAEEARDHFMPLVKLAPFVVNGEQLAISIHARSNRDRRYAEGFAGEVVQVVYEGVTTSTGKGLVIIGAKREPHPIVVFRQFLALAAAGKLAPAIAARAPELQDAIHFWQHAVDTKEAHGTKAEPGDGDEAGADLEFEKIVQALPLPLEGIGAKLYQLAWAEKFDEAKVEARLCALRPGDLERGWFTPFDWVFYLPPKGAFDRVLDEIIADALKEDDAGFFARVMVRSALLVVKPKIRHAIETLRQGMMLMTVAQARTHCSREDAEALMSAYVEALMPEHEHGETEGSEHDRAVRAVHDQMTKNAEQAKAAMQSREAKIDDPAAAAGEAETNLEIRNSGPGGGENDRAGGGVRRS